MSEPSPTVTEKRQLVAYLADGSTPRDDWRIGTEHEKLGFHLDDVTPLTYDGPRGIRAMLDGLRRFGWQPVYEGENIIALTMDGQSVSLEPGGQFELSGAPVATLHETCAEVHTHLAQVKHIADDLGIAFVGVGFQPKWHRGDIPIMPKGRYDIMRSYMEKVGNLGLDMMLRSATIQVNLDFSNEADMITKMRVGLALQPIATALFANSPFAEGKPNGFLSYRSHLWTDTDPDRTGILPFVFEDGMSFERYVDYALDVPMYFVYREGTYIDVSGQSFHDFLAGKLPGLPGERPTLDDWEAHLTTLFPEVRLKRYIEMRGADSGPWSRICGLPAFWVGLLYSADSLEAAYEIIKDWTPEDHAYLRHAAPKRALAVDFRGRNLGDWAGDVLALSRAGLASRAIPDSQGLDETYYLDPLDRIVANGKTSAEGLLAAYHDDWNSTIDALFKDCMY